MTAGQIQLPGQTDGQASWYAVQVQPRREKVAGMHLERQGYVHFSPRIERVRYSRGRRVTASEPMFPGYLFVRFDPRRDAWRSINGTIGVSRLVMFGDAPARLPGGLVERLRELNTHLAGQVFDTELKVGDKVRIVGGALNDLIGTLINADSGARVTILIDLLSGVRKVSVPRQRLIEA